MRAVLQRVNWARVTIEEKEIAQIGQGLLIFLGVHTQDEARDAKFLAEKTAYLRIFPDAQSKMNLSLIDTKREALVVSQFTLLADTSRGRRPNFLEAAQPEKAKDLYDFFCQRLREMGIRVQCGSFQAYMQVTLQNDGPVTIILDSTKKEG